MEECAAEKLLGPEIFIFASEKSADLIGKSLMQELKKQDPHCQFFGVGGTLMQQEGLSSIYPIEQFQVMGYSDILTALPRLLYTMWSLKKLILQKTPPVCLFIDAPSFSLRLAKKLKKAHFSGKIVQYVAPTVWAYKKERIAECDKAFDLLLTLFSFEPAYFAGLRMQTIWTGHPLIEEIEKHTLLSPTKKYISLFPGSRPAEIQRNLPIQLEAALLFAKNRPYPIAISKAVSQRSTEYEKIIQHVQKKMSTHHTIELIPFENRYEQMQQTAFCFAKSGTITLELGLFGVPTVVSYALTRLNRFVATYVLKLNLDYYSLVNILLKKEVFPECIKENPSPATLANTLLALANSQSKQELCKTASEELKALLKNTDSAAQCAARAIWKLLYDRS
jgi:lipid-A-disaccharide synthase